MKSVLVLLALVSSQSFAGGSSTLGPANPAAILCINIGGALDYSGNCLIGEWRLYSALGKSGLLKKHRSNGGANPAALSCMDVGGKLDYARPAQDTTCVVEEWSLWKAFNP